MFEQRVDYELDVWYMASPVSLLFFIGKTLRATFKRFTDVILPNTFILAWFAARENWIYIFVLVGIWIVAIFVIAIIRYRRFRFKLTETGISVRTGVIKEQHVDLQFERIRAVNLERGIVDRLLGLTGISFDTAGSGSAEATIPAVSLAFATSLREKIEERRTTHVDQNQMPNQSVAAAPQEQIILSYNWRQIAAAGLCSGNIAIALSIVAGTVGLFLQAFGQNLESEAGWNRITDVIDYVGELHSWLIPNINFGTSVFIVFVEMAIVLLILLLLFRVLQGFFKWHNFRLLALESSLKSVAGLKTVHEVRLDIPKIQSVTLKENLRSRCFSFFFVDAYQSQSDEKHRLTIPFSTTNMNAQLGSLMLPEAAHFLQFNPRSKEFIRISNAYFWIPVLKRGVVPTLIGFTVVLALFGPLYASVTLAWLVFIGGLQFLRWRKAGFMYNENAIVRRRGVLSYTLLAMKYSKSQTVEVVQSFVQKWTQKASLTVRGPTSSITIPYLDLDTAYAFRDYILYLIESSSEEWK